MNSGPQSKRQINIGSRIYIWLRQWFIIVSTAFAHPLYRRSSVLLSSIRFLFTIIQHKLTFISPFLFALYQYTTYTTFGADMMLQRVSLLYREF